MCNKKHVCLQALNFDNNTLQAKDDIKITLAAVSPITIMEFVLSTKFEFFRIFYLDFLGCKTITLTRILE